MTNEELQLDTIKLANRYLDAMSQPGPDELFYVAMADPDVDPVELYRQGLAHGNGNIWYVGTEKCATAITGNGPRSHANAEFYASAPTLMRRLLKCIEWNDAERADLRRQLAEAQARESADIAEVADLRRKLAEANAWAALQAGIAEGFEQQLAPIEAERLELRRQLAECQAKLAAVPMADIQRMQGCEAHTEGTEWAKIRVRQWLEQNGRRGI